MSVSAVLTQINTVLAAIEPTAPASAVKYSFVSPDDEPIFFRADDLPVLVTRRNPFIDHEVRRQTKSTYLRTWEVQALLFFAGTSLPDNEAEAVFYSWEGKFETALFTDPTLGGTVEWFGEIEQGGFDVELGHAPFYHTDLAKASPYWAIQIRLRVTTKHYYEMSF